MFPRYLTYLLLIFTLLLITPTYQQEGEVSLSIVKAWQTGFKADVIRSVYFNRFYYGTQPGKLLSFRESKGDITTFDLETTGDGFLVFDYENYLVITADTKKLYICPDKQISECKPGMDISILTQNEVGNAIMERIPYTTFIIGSSRKEPKLVRFNYIDNTSEKTDLDSPVLSLSNEEETPFTLLGTVNMARFFLAGFDGEPSLIDLTEINDYVDLITLDMAYDRDSKDPGTHFILSDKCLFMEFTTTKKLVKGSRTYKYCDTDKSEQGVYRVHKLRSTKYISLLFRNFLYFIHTDYFAYTDDYNLEVKAGAYETIIREAYPFQQGPISLVINTGQVLLFNGGTNSVCHAGCSECSEGMSYKKCGACEENFIKKEGICVESQCLAQNYFYIPEGSGCKKSCPLSFFTNNEAQVCERCLPDCEVCSNGKECERCNSRYVVSPEKDSCLDKCPWGHTAQPEGKICQPCHDTCKECDGLTKESCTSCSQKRNLENGVCKLPKGVKDCHPKLEYFDVAKDQCEFCHSSCNTCNGGTDQKCTSCTTDRYFIDNERCVEKCPERYFPIEKADRTKECLICMDNCEKCMDDVSCEKCKEGFNFLPSKRKCEKVEEEEEKKEEENGDEMKSEDLLPQSEYSPFVYLAILAGIVLVIGACTYLGMKVFGTKKVLDTGLMSGNPAQAGKTKNYNQENRNINSPALDDLISARGTLNRSNKVTPMTQLGTYSMSVGETAQNLNHIELEEKIRNNRINKRRNKNKKKKFEESENESKIESDSEETEKEEEDDDDMDVVSISPEIKKKINRRERGKIFFNI